MSKVFASPKGAISLNAVTATANGAAVSGAGGETAKGTLVTGAGVNAGTAKLQGSHAADFPNTPTELDSVDLAGLGASNSYTTLNITERFAFFRWITTGGAHGGTVTGYVQVYE